MTLFNEMQFNQKWSVWDTWALSTLARAVRGYMITVAYRMGNAVTAAYRRGNTITTQHSRGEFIKGG